MRPHTRQLPLPDSRLPRSRFPDVRSPRFRTASALLLPFLLLAWCATLLPAPFFGESAAIGVDPANYLLGIRSYSIAQERPHPPGYPVFIAICRAFSHVTGDEYIAIRLVVALFAVAAIVLTWRLAARWAGERTGRAAALLLALNPLFWFYACTSENYAFDAALGPGLVLLLVAARGRWWPVAGLALGLALGVRSTSVLLLAPMGLWILWRRSREGTLGVKDCGAAALGLALGVLAWLPWVLASEGGWEGYRRALGGLTTRSAGTFAGNAAGLAITLFWASVPLVPIWLFGLRRMLRAGAGTPGSAMARAAGPRDAHGALILWAAVPLLFFALIIHTKGYLLLVVPALAIGTAWLADAMPAGRRRALLGVAVAAGAAVFLAVPHEPPPAYAALAPRNRTSAERARSLAGRALSAYLPARSEIAARGAEVRSAVEMIRAAVGAGADTTLVVVDPAGSTFAHPRILEYYLPSVRFALPGVRNDRLLTFYQGLLKWKRFGDEGKLDAGRILLFTDRRLTGAYPMLAPLASHGDRLGALMAGNRADGPALRRTMDSLFTRWDEAGEGPAWIPAGSLRSEH